MQNIPTAECGKRMESQLQKLNNTSPAANLNQNVYKLTARACLCVRCSRSLTIRHPCNTRLPEACMFTGIPAAALLLLPCDMSHALVVSPLTRTGKRSRHTCKHSIASTQVAAITFGWIHPARVEAGVVKL